MAVASAFLRAEVVVATTRFLRRGEKTIDDGAEVAKEIFRMRRRCSGSHGGKQLLLYWLVIACSWVAAAQAQAQQAPRTDPVEVAALNAILGRWGKKASPAWNISGEPCSGAAIDGTDIDNSPNINPGIKCDCSFNNRTVCHITKLNLQQNYLTGPVPSFIGKLTFMQYLGIGSNNFTGELPEELGNLTKLTQLYIDSSGFSGPFPSTLSKLKNLEKLWASDNDFTGKIPDYLGTLTKLEELRIGDIVNGSSSLAFISNLTSLNILTLRNCKISDNLRTVNFSKLGRLTLLDLSFNNITGEVPQSILNLNNLGYLFLGNNSLTGSLPDVKSSSLTNLYGCQFNIRFFIQSTHGKLSFMGYQQQFAIYSTFRTKLFTARHSMFARFSGINKSMKGSDNTIYEVDAANLGVASYYVTGNTRWGVSNVGIFNEAPSRSYVINSSQQFQNTLDSELFQTARMSPSSLRYYGLGLENGNYSVKLQFAEFAYPDSKTWESTGRRIFDIYVQGDLKEKNFDIRKAAGGKSFTAVNKIYNTIVSKNFLEIHLFWAGKGTCCIPTQGYYGPMISALSVTPNFTPTVRNGVPKKKSKAELYNLAGRPNVFSNAELKLATENFSSQNMVGEGGYGQVYKGKLPDGRVIAVKQLSQSSHQGKSEFVTEVATISAVQHRNLVKLHGCCIDSNTPLLVYEYLENGSLDRALFGSKSFNLDWPTRFEIILGVARGLTYLHEESSVRIVHRDIKASNVLLDTDLTPKISDFGLAKLYDEKKTHISTKIAGTLGYLAPEYAMRGHLTEKADVFAFGVVALEIVAGRPNTENSREEDKIYLFEWAWTLYERGQALGIVDPKLKEFNEKEALRVICAALLCTQGSSHQRPSMSRVMAILAGDIEVTEVVTKPSYITEWQLRGDDTSYATSSYYSGSTTGEFREKRDTAPLNSYPGITGRIDEGSREKDRETDRVIRASETERAKEMTRRRCCSSSSGSRGHGGHQLILWLLIACSWVAVARAQVQKPAATTDPVEVAALNTILGRWGTKPPKTWNTTGGDPCTGTAVDDTNIDDNPVVNPGIKCDCTFNNNTVCRIVKLRVYALNVVGQIPAELEKLTYLANLNLMQNYLTGPVPSFFGKYPMQYLSLAINPLSGPLPKELGNLTNLISLGISLNNFTGNLPEELGNLTKLEQLYIDSSGFSGPFPSTISKLKKLKILWISDNDFTGKIPDFIGSLTNLEDLRIGDIVNGSSSLAFISNLTSLNVLILRNCKISDNLGSVNFTKLSGLTLLFLGNNSLTGSLPDEKSSSLNNLYAKMIFSIAMIYSFHTLTLSTLCKLLPDKLNVLFCTRNLVANRFNIHSNNNSILPSGLNCLQRDTPCFLDYSFAVDSGSNRSVRSLDNTMYEADATNLGAASYYVTGQTRWGISNVGKFNEAPNGSYLMYSSQQFQNALDSELFQTARMSPSSLRYYGLGLENGNYTVLLQFAEFAYPDTKTWQSIGRRVFDIYVQGDLKEKNFDVRKTAGGKSFTAVYKRYNATVSKNFLEIHLFWAGKGTCCIPTQGYYGPMISALSITPNFTPTVRNGVPKKKSKAGAISGIVIGASVLGSAALLGIFLLIKKRRKVARQQEELYNLVGRPNIFSSAELKLATDNFSSQNVIGEGGYGPVYKGKLPDGRIIAVKQLSQSSHQGKSEFVTEVATISAVQHRNLVKLYGCCIDSSTPLLVYEYLENGSLDRALFGHGSLNLGWPTRFEIILGIARGITYLHEESSIRIVHRDIKASNVLLDTDLSPKISDFGLAKLYDEKKTHISTKIAGTFGYLAPEYAMRGHLTEKADVFAFGVVALETVAGRSNTDNSLDNDKIYLFEWAWGLYEREQGIKIVDPKLDEFDSEEAFRVIYAALLCTQGSPHQRPPMSRVLAILTGDIEMTEMVTKPTYITEWQLRGGNTSYVSSNYSSVSTTGEFREQRETSPLTPSPTITGVTYDGR
uniref:non-specific serine/threonine protein kinase n=1 Tax=Oryza punctata TaxID=4537 RepID=A0A0E0LS89_ORYPU